MHDRIIWSPTVSENPSPITPRLPPLYAYSFPQCTSHSPDFASFLRSSLKLRIDFHSFMYKDFLRPPFRKSDPFTYYLDLQTYVLSGFPQLQASRHTQTLLLWGWTVWWQFYRYESESRRWGSLGTQENPRECGKEKGPFTTMGQDSGKSYKHYFELCLEITLGFHY